MKSPQPSSEDSLSQLSKNKRKVRFTTNEKFKVNLKNIKIKHRESKFFQPQEFPTAEQQQEEDLKQSFYFRVRVISKIAVFIQKLKTLVALSNPNFKNNQMDYIQTQITSDNSRKFIFSGENRIVLLIEGILLITSMISIWNASFLLLFPSSFLLPMQLRVSMIVLFGLEIVMSLFVVPTSSLKEQYKIDHRSVILQYLKGGFFYDCLSFLCLIILELVPHDSPVLYVVKCFAILKIVTVLKVIKKFEALFITTPESESQINIIKLILNILTFVHLLSLTLNLINQVEIDNGIHNTWLRKYGMGEATDFEMYLCGWYWGATILTTVGFGDIAPANIYEAFAISLIQIICCAIFGYSINYIGGLIGVLGESTQLFEKQMRRVNKYLQNLDVDKTLKEGIRQHFYNKQKIKEIHDPVAQSIVMDNIPVSMKTQVLSANNKNVLQKTGFFQRYNENIINVLALKLKKIIYSPDEAIFNKGDSNAKLWILEKGNIGEFYNNEPNNIQKIIAQYNPSTVQAGYINFITGQPFTTYCRSLQFSWAYQLSREDMLSVLVQFKTEYHKFCQLKDRLIQKGKKFVSRCCACSKLSHNALQCPKIHFQAKIKLYKLACLSRMNINIRQFYPRSSEKYKSLALFYSMSDQQSLNSNSIYINNNRRMSVEDMVTKTLNSHRPSRRISTIIFQRPQFKLPPIYNPVLQASKQYLKTETQVKVVDPVQDFGQLQLKFWFDQCKFSEGDSYFSQNHVENVVASYNKLVQKNKENSRNFKVN